MVVPFHSVNRRNSVGYRNGWQRHHLIPTDLANRRETAAILRAIEPYGFSLDDFAFNGMLLPATDIAASRSGLPVHAGPHPIYTRRVAAMIVEVADRSPHPIKRLARMRALQINLRRTLREPVPAGISIEMVTLSIDWPLIHSLDAQVEAMLDSFAAARNSA